VKKICAPRNRWREIGVEISMLRIEKSAFECEDNK
jgi:hypothetical protein